VNDSVALAGDSAARHLLHNLRNAKALRQNPLVAHLFSDGGSLGSQDLSDRVVISRVVQAVASVLRGLGPGDGNPFDGNRPSRQTEIIRRCVLGAEPYKAVARDLAISLRTLFRDLDGIRLRLAEELPRYSPAPAIVEAAADTFELEIRHAHLLRNMGRFDEALAVLDRLVSAAGSPLQRVRAWNSSAIALVDSGETEKASAKVTQARAALLRLDDVSEAPKALAGGDIELTDGMIYRVVGDTRGAIESYDKAAEQSSKFLQVAPESAVDVFVRAQAQTAVISWLTGDMASASMAVEHGWNALEGMADPPESAHYALLASSALVHVVADGDVAWAIREMSAAAVLAERRGMLHDALMALGYLSGLQRSAGNLAGALETSRRTIAIARNTMTGTEFAQLCAAAAGNEADGGDAVTAMRLIEEGRARVAPGGSGWARLLLGEAHALLAGKRYAETIATAERAVEAMQRQGKAVFVGSAYYLKAVAHEHRGERAQALLASREALPLLERFGKSPELAAALELSARLTGNRRLQASAVELRKLLRG
jgi:tetratricopeptide (TPR) repeat protein